MTDSRSGFIAVVGRPNVGKSTLINALIGQKIAAVSPRPQTTRRRQLGILTRPGAQLVLVDTPGIHEPRHKLGMYMNQEAQASLEGVDAVLFVVDLSADPTDDDVRIVSILRRFASQRPVILAANKIDLVDAGEADVQLDKYRELLPAAAATVLISASRGRGLDQLVDVLVQNAPLGPPEYDEEQITDLYEREIAADLIREAALLKLRDEVPHGIAIRVDEFKERDNGMTYIAATLLVERSSQKAIVIGQGARMLKQIGTSARQEIEAMGGRKVFLELRVKVEKGWRNNQSVLDRLGYKIRR
jgi:GTP-binding protein Era